MYFSHHHSIYRNAIVVIIFSWSYLKIYYSFIMQMWKRCNIHQNQTSSLPNVNHNHPLFLPNIIFHVKIWKTSYKIVVCYDDMQISITRPFDDLSSIAISNEKKMRFGVTSLFVLKTRSHNLQIHISWKHVL